MAFERHQAWVLSLRESLQSHSQRNSQRVEPEGDTSWSSMFRAPSWSSDADPGVTPVGFDRQLEDHDFDEPAYRSFGHGLATFDSEGSQDFEVGHEPAVYRSFDFAIDDLHGAETDGAAMDSDWLATMPPLVHRQPAGVLA